MHMEKKHKNEYEEIALEYNNRIKKTKKQNEF